MKYYKRVISLNNLDERLKMDVENGVFPGMNYEIVSNEDIMGSVGYKQLVPYKEKLDIDTLYDVASLTKVIVTVPLICKLICDKGMRFDDKVKKYLPRFKHYDVTIYHLLSHTSGLPADLDSKKITTKHVILDEVYSKDKIYETGKEVVYSDLGYILLGEIIEKVYNKPLDIVASEEIFTPLQMYNTSYKPTNIQDCAPTEIVNGKEPINGFVHDEKACSMNGVAGHAGVFSNVPDLMKFVKMILNNGVYNNKQFLSKDMIDLWFRPMVYEKQNERTRSLCWITGVNDIVNREGENVISFSGFTGPSLSIDRDRKLGIVLMTNRVHPTRDNKKLTAERPLISKEIYDSLYTKHI